MWMEDSSGEYKISKSPEMTENRYEILKSICQARKSIRRFSDGELPEESIQKIIEIARTAPYASGLKNWNIQVVKSKEVISQMAECIKRNADKMSLLVKENLRQDFLNYSKNFTFFGNAPVIFILTFRVSPVIKAMMGDNAEAAVLQWERDNFTKSISCVAMLVLLAAESLGYGACYMTGPLIAQNEIMILLDSKPGREIGAIIPVGFKENQ